MVGFFVFIISLIKSKLEMSNEEILNNFTFNLSKKFTDSLSNGVEKKNIFFLSA